MRYLLVFLCFAAMLFVACDSTPTDPQDGLNVPGAYPSTDFNVNASAELVALNDLAALTDEMKKGRTHGVQVPVGSLTPLYARISQLSSSYYNAKVINYMSALSDASGWKYDPTKLPAQNGPGGVYAGYLFDKHGMELEQLIEKGLFGGGHANTALVLMQTPDITPEIVDKIVALFGAKPSFPNSDAATSDPDKFSAKYAARRDKNDGKGFYTQFRDAAKVARAAAASTEYRDSIAPALKRMREAWEKSAAATSINYLYSVIDILSQTSVDSSQRASAMHAYAEAVAFVNGWKGLPASLRIATDAQITDWLQVMLADDAAPWKCYELWQNPATTLPRLVTAIERIQTVYGFTAQDLEDFKTNWVSAQDRK